MADTPLQGIKVISFGTGGVIPDFGMILGSLGADVIKVECRENPDFMRTIGADPDNIAGFNESNRNKRDIGLNLKVEKGQEIARRLIKGADIVGENLRGGVMKSLNMDYENVRKFKPDIIYISSNGYGSGGPYSEYQAYGPMLSAFSGLLSLWCHPTDPYPAGANVPLPDHYASKMLVVAALAALDYRRRTGKGQLVDMSQVEMAANMIGEYCLDYTINERVPQPVGNRSPYAAPYNAYRCKGNDEWCAISVFTDAEWQSFCRAIGSPHWTKEAKFADLPSRLKHVEELDKHVEEWTLQHEAARGHDGPAERWRGRRRALPTGRNPGRSAIEMGQRHRRGRPPGGRQETLPGQSLPHLRCDPATQPAGAAAGTAHRGDMPGSLEDVGGRRSRP